MFNAVRAATVRARAGAGPAGGARGGRPGPPASAVAAGTASGPAGRALAPQASNFNFGQDGTPFARRARAGRGRRGGATGGLTDAPPAAHGLQGTTAAQDAFADPTRVSYTGGRD